MFKLNLELENYPDAYTAMTSNTDDDRRKDCLRNFVLHLSEKGDLAPLVEAPYGGLEAEIGSILENRALAVSGIFLNFTKAAQGSNCAFEGSFWAILYLKGQSSDFELKNLFSDFSLFSVCM